MCLVLVYGTLKRGFPNHDADRLAGFYSGTGRTVERYPLCVAGPWFSPVVFAEPGTGERIVGELYDVDPDTLEYLDRLEKVGRPNGYQRRLVSVERDAGPFIDAWCYMKMRGPTTAIHSGYLADYQDRRYVPRHMRPTTGRGSR